MEGSLEFLNQVSVICLLLALAFGLLSVWLFFRLGIRDVILELSGKARAKALRRLDEQYGDPQEQRQSAGPQPAADRTDMKGKQRRTGH